MKQRRHKTTLEHFNKYDALCKVHGIGPGDSETYMGRTKAQWEAEYERDRALNGVPLREFDALYVSGRRISLSENTSMHKHAVIYKVLGLRAELVETWRETQDWETV